MLTTEDGKYLLGEPLREGADFTLYRGAARGDKDRVLRLKLVLWHFIQMHNDVGAVAASGGARRA